MKNLINSFRFVVFLIAASFTPLAGASVATVTWTGLGADQLWSDTANWSGGTPQGNIVVFPSAMFPASTNTLGATNNIVDTSMGVSQLWYNNTNGFLGVTNFYDTTLLAPNVTLMVTNSFYAGANSGANATTVAAILGTNCTFIVSNLAGTFGVGYTNAANVQLATLTLPDGTNFIEVGTFAVGNSDGGNGRQSILNLGNGTNIILSPYIELGWSKALGRIEFVGPYGGLLMANTNGGRTAILVGRGSSGTASVNGQLALTNYANILGSTVTNGWGAASSSGGSPQGTITVQQGIFDATTLVIGANTGGTQSASGTFNLGGGVVGTATMIINSPAGPGGGLFLLSDANNGSQTGTGTFNINTNGIAEIYCSINKFQQNANTATINLNGGTLIMEAVSDVVGSAATPIDNLNLNGGVLQLSVDGSSTATANITANSVIANPVNGMNVINIGSVANVLVPETIHLIKYANGSDPGLGNFMLGSYPAGYNATLQDDGSQYINLNISANIPIVPLLWVGAVGSTINSNWNFTTQDWNALATATPSYYVNPDLTAFDDSASNSTLILATNFTPGALTFSNSTLSYLLEGSGSIRGSVGLEMDGSSMVTLAETGGDSFSGGVMVNNGMVILDDANSTVSGNVAVNSGATLQVGNNDSNGSLPSAGALVNGTLILDQTSSGTISGPITGYGALTLNGSGKVTMTSAANAYTGNTTINAGTLALTGSCTVSNSGSVIVAGGTLDVSGETGVSLVNYLNLANASVIVTASNSAYLQAPIYLTSGLNLGGTGNTITVTALPTIASYPSPVTLIQSAGGIAGSFNMTLNPLPSGYSGYVTNMGNSVVLVLTAGPTGVRPYVTWSGVDATAGLNTNWTDAMNWELPGVPSSTDTIIFDTSGQQTASAYTSPGGGATDLDFANVNNIVDTNFTVSTLTYTNIGNSGAPSFQNTYITNGATLLVTNSLSIGTSSTDYGSTAQENVTFSGQDGTLTVTNPSSTFIVNLINSGTPGEQAILDMSGLGTFNANVSLFEVGAIASTADDVSGVAYLAQTNTIIATGGNNGINEGGQDEALSLLVGETGKGASTEAYLYLGQQNIIHAYTIGVGIAKDVAEIEFNPNLTSNPSTPPTVSIIGGDGVSPVQALAIGDALAQSGSSTAPAGTVDFTGGIVNAQVSVIYLGRSANVSGAKSSQGTLTFGQGIIAAGTIYDGFEPYNDTDYGFGTINVNGTGQLNVNALNLAWTSGTLASPTMGTLNITGGTVMAGTIAADTNNFGQSSVNLTGGLLVVTNSMGTTAAPLYTLNLNGGTLQLSPTMGTTNVVATGVSIGSPTTLNISSISTTMGGAQQIQLISYLNGSDPTLANLTLGSVPAGYTAASLLDDGAGHIYLNITAPASLVWAGTLSGGPVDGNWNTSDQNWLNGVTYTAYQNPDFVQFTDTASSSAVNVAANVSPDSFIVNNSTLNYVFSGSYAITGTGGLTKSGGASLTLADTGGDSFSGGITVNGGAVVLDDAGSSIGGNVAINGGSVQLGNNDANGNLPGNITDNGSLILDRSNPLAVAGIISGSGSVMQVGANTVTLSGANAGFTGKLTITNGILNTTLSSGLGAATATTMVTNSGTFDDNGVAFNNVGAPTLVVSGAGYNGAGAIVNSGAQQVAAFSNIVVAANVTIGGANRWDLRAGTASAASLTMSPPGTPYSITKVGTNEIALVSVGAIDAGLGNIYLQQGEFAIQESTVQLGNPASNLVVSAGALLEMYGAPTPLNKVISFNGDGVDDSFKSDNDTAGQNVIAGPITLNGNCVFDISSGAFATIDSVIGGTGGLVKITQGVLTLTNVNTYTGNTSISNGVLALTGSGSIASTNIFVASGANLNASGRTDQTLTLANNQILSGFGSVTGLVVEASGATIAPGTVSSTGALTFGTNVTLAGATSLKVSALSGLANDTLNISGTLALGGALNVTSLGGTYATGESFQLFTASGAVSGAFSATNLPALSSGLGWVTTNLIHGIISIGASSVNTTPTNIMATVSGNTLTLAWPADHTGWRLEVETNSDATGLNPNAGAWYTVPGSTGVDTESIAIDPSQGNVFYRLVYP